MSYLKKIIYNCRQATYLIEKRSLQALNFREKAELRIHLYGCGFCRLFSRQSNIINEMVRELFRGAEHSDSKLDENFKTDLQERIEQELNKT